MPIFIGQVCIRTEKVSENWNCDKKKGKKKFIRLTTVMKLKGESIHRGYFCHHFSMTDSVVREYVSHKQKWSSAVCLFLLVDCTIKFRFKFATSVECQWVIKLGKQLQRIDIHQSVTSTNNQCSRLLQGEFQFYMKKKTKKVWRPTGQVFFRN